MTAIFNVYLCHVFDPRPLHPVESHEQVGREFGQLQGLHLGAGDQLPLPGMEGGDRVRGKGAAWPPQSERGVDYWGWGDLELRRWG